MTFVECVAAGTAFGIKAFFAVTVFLLCVGVVLELLALIGAMLGGDGE